MRRKHTVASFAIEHRQINKRADINVTYATVFAAWRGVDIMSSQRKLTRFRILQWVRVDLKTDRVDVRCCLLRLIRDCQY